ncbi:MAG: hypothetical protein IPJ34_38485 [Myxococcales bacterium]|nr:hypothetical protein [Myxococcales bacterium]
MGEAGADAGSCIEACREAGVFADKCGFTTIVDAGKHPAVECTQIYYCEGRLPAALLDAPPGRPDVATHFASAAFLEAAAIDAFRLLARELVVHGAPRRLVEAARRARRDEIRHARTMRALARRHGAHHVRPPRVGESPVRELVAIAVENAIEGCVRETWGAALAWFQATHAADPIVRSAMARIARDETQHAALGWSLHHWAMTRLPAAQRAEVARALEGARAALHLAVATVPDQDIRHRLGLPDATQAAALVRAVESVR